MSLPFKIEVIFSVVTPWEWDAHHQSMFVSAQLADFGGPPTPFPMSKTFDMHVLSGKWGCTSVVRSGALSFIETTPPKLHFILFISIHVTLCIGLLGVL